MFFSKSGKLNIEQFPSDERTESTQEVIKISKAKDIEQLHKIQVAELLSPPQTPAQMSVIEVLAGDSVPRHPLDTSTHTLWATTIDGRTFLNHMPSEVGKDFNE